MAKEAFMSHLHLAPQPLCMAGFAVTLLSFARPDWAVTRASAKNR
jgi:hypothetical protein